MWIDGNNFEDFETKCEICGVSYWDKDVQLTYDEDGRLICTDCFFEEKSEELFLDEYEDGYDEEYEY